MIVREIINKIAITKSALPETDYVLNAYTGCTHKCLYCYAEFIKKFTNHSKDVWGEFIDVKMFDKIKIPKSIENKCVYISSITDPYNHYEMKYEKTKQVLEALKNINCHVKVFTKSKNVLRDIELFKQFKNIEVGISLCTLNDDFRKLIEPRASSVEERIEVLKILRENNIRNKLSISPVFPHLSNYKKIIEQTKDFVDSYELESLNLKAEYRARILNLIKQRYTRFSKTYNDIYKRYNQTYWIDLKTEITEYCKENNIECSMRFHHESIQKKAEQKDALKENVMVEFEDNFEA